MEIQDKSSADKDEELSRSIKRWQMGTLDHVEPEERLNFESAKLDESNPKCVALEAARGAGDTLERDL